MSDDSAKSLTQKEFNLFRELIYKEAGISLGSAKQQLVESRLSKRLRILDLSSFTDYYNFLQSDDRDGSERLKMINSLTTNKTDFFREGHHFDYLRSTVFPMMEKRAKETGERRIRIWSAACSTGEEPYTLAMTVLDHFGPAALHGWDIRILASDVDTDVLAHARTGVYAADRVADVPRDVLKRHFLKTSKDPEAPVQVNPRLQELIAFRRINFIEPEWPVNTYFDIIFCRNVMIYFDEKTQDTLLSRFSSKMVPEGHLFIGHSESILRLDQTYKSLGNTIYRLAPGVGDFSTATERTGNFTPASVPARSSRASAESSKVSPVTNRTGSAITAVAPSISATPRSSNALSHSHVEPQSIPTTSIIVGEVKASSQPTKVTTLVGSCIAVCLFDPIARVGGMNHFMLPANDTSDAICATYGIHAMELLINEIMRKGGDRRRLNAKVFGGGNVLGKPDLTDSVWAIGERNIKFAFEFLQTDNIPVVASDVGGSSGRQIQFLTHTGQAFVRPLEKVAELVDQENMPRRRARPEKMPQPASVVLF